MGLGGEQVRKFPILGWLQPGTGNKAVAAWQKMRKKPKIGINSGAPLMEAAGL